MSRIRYWKETNMAFVDVGIAAASMVGVEGLGTVAAGAIGSGLVGAGVGGLMAGIQGKNVLNGALMGGALGAVGGGIGGSFMGGAAGDVSGTIGTDIASMNAAGASSSQIAESLMANYGMTAEQATTAMGQVANGTGTTAGIGALANDNAVQTAAGGVNAGGATVGTSAGTGNTAVNAAKQVMTNPSTSNSLLKYAVPAAMVAYGSGLFGNKTSGPGITSQNTIGQSKPVPGIMSAQLSPNYQGYFQAKKGGIAKLAVGGGAEAQMTPDVNQTSVNPADLNQSKSASLSPQTQSLLNQYGINQSQATGVLSALQSQGIGNQPTHAASGGIMGLASGGGTSYHLGGYSDGGRLLKGPGDGMSDEIPATIGHKQPARLADGEFVVPADVVSHLGNGSTDAGAKHLYKMMDKVRTARVGHKKQGKQIKADKYLPK